MAVDDARNAVKGTDEHVDDVNDDGKFQGFTDYVLDLMTIVGNATRGFFTEAVKCLKSCAYPIKECCVKFYDNATNNFVSRGTRNVPSNDNVTRFGSGSTIEIE